MRAAPPASPALARTRASHRADSADAEQSKCYPSSGETAASERPPWVRLTRCARSRRPVERAVRLLHREIPEHHDLAFCVEHGVGAAGEELDQYVGILGRGPENVFC